MKITFIALLVAFGLVGCAAEPYGRAHEQLRDTYPNISKRAP
jgi:hypothetical protein